MRADPAWSAAFHAPVPEALEALGGAGDRVVWLRSVVLGASGEYGPALEALEVVRPGSICYSMAESLRASLLRQLGCHDLARRADRRALAASRDPVARIEAWTGLAADAVGLGEARAAQTILDRVGMAVGALSDPAQQWWRQDVRLCWVRCEVHLLCDEYGAAATQAQVAVRIARAADAPRHLAKSLMFAGVCRGALGEVPAARALLEESLGLSTAMGFDAVAWPAHAVLGALLDEGDPAGVRRHHAAACEIVSRVLAGLQGEPSVRWAAREDLRHLCRAAGPAAEQAWDAVAGTD